MLDFSLVNPKSKVEVKAEDHWLIDRCHILSILLLNSELKELPFLVACF